jgi:hypothetical protein
MSIGRLGIAVFGAVALAAAAYPAYEGWRVHEFETVRNGMTDSQVRELLDSPSEERGTGPCLAEETCGGAGKCWLYRQRLFEHLVVRFDPKGKVTCRDVYRPEVRRSG